jgi:hypothetical protein
VNVPTVTMNRAEAKEKYEQYKAALEDRAATEEDETILLGYKALAAGKQLLNLFDVFRTCPLTPEKLPRFAVGRAHWKMCFHRREGWGSALRAVFAGNLSRLSSDGRGSGNVFIPQRMMPQGWESEQTRRALVPLIPVSLRPKSKPERYHILWEAEWQPIAPKDPLLLSRLSGSLYVILAAWDLTELERAVLAGRFAEDQ